MTDRRVSADKEAILVALDQLSQTMEVMAQVINRLKRTVQQAQLHEPSAGQSRYDTNRDHTTRDDTNRDHTTRDETARENNLEALRKSYIRKKAKALQQSEQLDLDSKPVVVLH